MTSKTKRSHWLAGKGKVDAMLSFDGTFADSLRHAPRGVLRRMTCYKFAARMIGVHKRVLDIGCGEGLGTWLLAIECGKAEGLDCDAQMVATAKSVWTRPGIRFECGNITTRARRAYDGIVCFDQVGGIAPRRLRNLIEVLADNLAPSGIVIIGMPFNRHGPRGSARACTSPCHGDCGGMLERTLRRRFQHVFPFSAHDQGVYAGFLPTTDYLMAVACFKKRQY